MDVIATIRRMWRLRFFLALGVAFALIVATLLTYNIRLGLPPTFESRQYHVGLASTSVLLDSQSSQVADLGDPETSAGPGIFAVRAQLLANLVLSNPLRDRIAADAGVAPNRLHMTLTSNNPNTPFPQPAEAPGVVGKPSDRDARVLRITINDLVPIITFNAQAPTAEHAARLAVAAVAVLRTQVQQTASADGVPNERKLVFEPLGQAARSATETRGPTKAGALVKTLLLFAIWCAAVIGVEALARRWRHAGAADVDAPTPDEPPVRSAPPRAVPPAAAARPSVAPVERSLAPPERLEQRAQSRRSDPTELDDWIDAPEKPPVGPRRVA